MSHRQPDLLPADLVTDDATAWGYAFGLQPTVAPSATPATVTARLLGQGLFIRVLVAEDLPAADRELLGELARARVVRLLRAGTAEGGWAWDATARQWTVVVRLPDDVSTVVPDHVPDEWTRAA